MRTIYFLDFIDPVVFKGKGKFVATSKAREDVTHIVKRDFKHIYVPIIRRWQNPIIGVLDILYKIYISLRRIPKHSYILIQYPMINIKAFKLIAFFFKDFHTIALIHDLPSYRHKKAPTSDEIKILNNFNTVIVHSQNMKNRLIKDGLKVRTEVLEIFDYLLDSNQQIKKTNDTIVFAGSLSKSIFLKELSELSFKNIKFNVYGKGLIDGVKEQFVNYKGVFYPNDITTIEGDWGLLWEGTSIETCTGNLGSYLTLIAPHKLSLYLACGLKIIAWEGSAMAQFIKENNIGITIHNLNEIEKVINNLPIQAVEEMEKNIIEVSKKIRKGFFLRKILSTSIDIR